MAVLALMLFAALPLAAQTPAMRERLNGTVGALNGTAEEFEAYAQQAFAKALLDSQTPQQRREWHGKVKADFGQIAMRGVMREGPAQVRIRFDGGANKKGFILFEHEAEAPHKLTKLEVEADAGRADGPPINGNMADAEMARVLDRHLQGMSNFSGAVLVARDGKPVFQKGYGLANRSDRVANTESTRFNIGSINKFFTRAAIAQLAAAGKLAVEDAIGKHLSDHPNERAKKATIQQMLEHEGGVPNWQTDPEFVRASKGLFRTNRDFYRLVAPKPLDFEPGSRNQYCNSCYVLLGEIIERLSGMPYEKYVEQNVLAPAGMRTAGFFQLDEPVPQLAIGYTARQGTLRANVHDRGAGGNAAGGAYATVADLLAFDNALRDGKLLDAKWTAWFFGAPQPITGRAKHGAGYAGGGPGLNASVESDGKWTVIVMANDDPPAASDVAEAIFGQLSTRSEP